MLGFLTLIIALPAASAENRPSNVTQRGQPACAPHVRVHPGNRQATEDAYRARRYITQREQGRHFNARDMAQREARVLANHERTVAAGLEQLRAGEYRQALIALTMAAELNHGDPACRIHLAQARMALGHYDEAGASLRRALQLQPKLRFMSLGLPSYYFEEAEFDRHVDQLAAWLKANRATAETYFLLGYMEFQRGNFDTAHAAFRVAQRGLRDDALTASYLELTKPAQSAPPTPPAARNSP
jgi:tetratricopeptide (TPR) repeat protein